MNIDQLRAKFANENVCRQFLGSIIWQHCRICPHCQCQKSYAICGASARPGLYNVLSVNGNLPSPPKRRYTATSCRYGSGC